MKPFRIGFLGLLASDDFSSSERFVIHVNKSGDLVDPAADTSSESLHDGDLAEVIRHVVRQELRREARREAVPELLPREEAADVLSVSTRTLDTLRADGQITAIKLRGRALYDAAVLAAYVESLAAES